MSDCHLPKVLYLPSTPLNLLVSVAHALHFKEQQRSQLVLIDQKPSEKESQYYNWLNKWNDSPFESVFLTQDAGDDLNKTFSKLEKRKRIFKQLDLIAENFQADIIATGSDRRVEFQYLMHKQTSQGIAAKGWYLDDGLYSYAGRPYHVIKDGLNSLLKKSAYGAWWREPKTVGASPWINDVWLFQPDQAVLALQEKKQHTLLKDWFLNDEIKKFSTALCNDYGFTFDGQNPNVLILIPHPNNIEKMPGYLNRIEVFISKVQKAGFNIAVKYHPRTETKDPFEFKARFGVKLIPAALAFEFVLPLLKSDSYVIGDVGTSLLTANWLRPDLKSIAVLNKDSEFEANFQSVMLRLGVTVKDDFDAVMEVIHG
jgi:hypothetical protein